MTKNLFLVLLFTVQTAFAQITSKDNNFASNGIYSILTGNNTNSSPRMVQDSNGSIYFTYNRNDSSTGGLEKSFLSKLNANGIVDTSFGTNGELTLPHFIVDSQIKIQSDGKLLIYLESDILRVLPSGQFDNTFGTNGVSSAIPAMGSDSVGYSGGFILQNGKIIVHGINNSQHLIYRLNTDGSIDTTFGNDGSIFTQGSWSNATSTFVDNQSNIVSIHLNGIIEKFNPNGLPLTSFGNNGVFQGMSNNYARAIMDSNNNIVYTSGTGQINRIKSDGTFDSSFNFNPITSIPFPIWILSIVEKNGHYYIGGAKEVNNDIKFFISKLNQNGTMNSAFNYYVETNPTLNYLDDMIVNDNNIIADGNGYIVKYLLTNGTLSTTDMKKAIDNITFENPVKQNLVYQSNEKVSKIEIYSSEGKILKVSKESNLSVSGLPKGIYMAKVTFENGSITTKKLIKN
ncbi:T9SS type A sorting domain-containing protein [Chryseobacterium sp.]|uniref:T9SS type A sorting domain-containing protein n=1 Tax=Chryseobacterium sp. TaxID=1871047 RepID=UPI00321B0363